MENKTDTRASQVSVLLAVRPLSFFVYPTGGSSHRREFFCVWQFPFYTNDDTLLDGEKVPMPSPHPFLTAEWRYLIMLNYEIDPTVLEPLLPAGTVLDLWQGKALASVVGFMFQRTRVLGIPPPFHTRFEEVNLRFYVTREAEEEQRRGVVFVKEIVPKPWIAQTACVLYGEPYVALPMRHTLEANHGALSPGGLVEYSWRFRGRLNRLGGLAYGDPQPLQESSEEAFITEHYWGYTRLGQNRTGEYEVVHPRWRAWRVDQPYLLCDVKTLYGRQFEEALGGRPRSAFLAEGSPITVRVGAGFRI